MWHVNLLFRDILVFKNDKAVEKGLVSNIKNLKNNFVPEKIVYQLAKNNNFED